jgi:hypothetical protein
MKERVTTAVSPGEVLQVHSSRGPIGQPVTVPEGVNSVTVIFRDTEGMKGGKGEQKGGGAKHAKQARPGGRGAGGGGGGGGGKRRDDDED